MLISVGNLLGSAPRPPLNKLIETTLFSDASLSELVTFTRAGNTATTRDSNGDWQTVAVNTPRIDHDSSGTLIGQRIEPPRPNKVNHYNFAPADIGDIAVVNIGFGTGDGAASVVSDPTGNIENATISGSTFADIQNGNVIQLTGGTSGTSYRLSIDAGNTNAHSWRGCFATAAAGYSGTFRFSDGAGTQNISPASANTFYELTKENIAPGASARFLCVHILAGKTVYLIGAQLEEGSFLTTPIITTSTAGTQSRGREVPVANDTGWLNNVEGTILGEFIFDHVTGFDSQYAFLACEGTGLTNAMGIYINGSSSSQARARDIIGSTNNQNNDIHKPIEGRRFPVAIAWKDGESYAIAGAMTYNHVERAGSPTGMDRVYLGGRPYGNAMSGWIKSVKVYNQFLSLSEIGAQLFPSSGSYKAIGSGGQSNMRGKFRDTNTQLNGGEVAGLVVLDSFWTTTENWMLNAAVDGSGLTAISNAVNYWITSNYLTDGGGADGNCLTRWKAIATAFGVDRIPAIHWDQAATDATHGYDNIFWDTLETLTRMRNHLGGNVPVLINPIAARGDQAVDAYNDVKRAHEDLAENVSWIHLAPPQNNVTFGADNIHLSDSSYADMTTIQMRKILSLLGETVSGAVDAPEILSAVRSGTTITAPVTFPTGITAITPTSAIAGFRFFDNTTEIAITAATYAAGDITITLDSAPVSGTENLYFGYGSMYDEIADVANFPIGNDANGLGIQNTAIIPSVV